MERSEQTIIYDLLDLNEGPLPQSTPENEPLPLDRMSAIEKYSLHNQRRQVDEESILDMPIEEMKEYPIRKTRDEFPRNTTKRQFMKPGRFDGTGSLESFLRQFEVCSSHNQWTQKEKTDFLQCALEKSATQLLWDFGSKSDVTYEDLTERLRQRYGLETQAETFRTQLRCRKQRDKESLADLLHDIRRLVTLAYPAPASETTEAIARDAFLDAMLDSELSLKVREREPRSLDETFRTAVRLETYKKSLRNPDNVGNDRRDTRRQVRATKEDDQIAELTAQIKDLCRLRQREQEELAQWKRSIEERFYPPNQTPLRSNYPEQRNEPTASRPFRQTENSFKKSPMDDGKPTIRCYNCQKLGHLSKNCRAPRKQAQNTASVNFNTASRSSGAGGLKSLYVHCRINGIDCLSLIDTGSEINLLPMSLTNQAQLSTTSQRLYAANGSEIKVRGETSVNVSFNRNCKRRITFVVSEQISEVMLGMEFLNTNNCGLSFAKGKLFIGRNQVPLVRKNGTGWCRRVQAVDSIEIPPRSQVEIQSKIIQGDPETTSTSDWMMEHQELYPGVHTARILVDNAAKETRVRVINTNEKTVKVDNEAVLGELQNVEIIKGTITRETLHNTTVNETIETLITKVDTSLSNDMKIKLKAMLEEFPDVFSQHKNDLGRCEIAQHRIDTGNARPVRQPLRTQPRVYREFIDETVEQMVKDELIEPAQSEWASNIVLVKKKDGTLRFCLDYRALNVVTRGDTYPLPKINDCLDALAGAQWFSTLDLTSGYHQIAMNAEDADKTTFITRKGSFRWKRMPMGLSGATATFQRTMDLILSGINFSTCLVYLDDVIIFSDSPELHIQRLREVFTRLRQANLKLKVSKCQLMKRRVEFLGHVVSHEGISVDPSKVEKVETWPIPKNLKELRAFLGLCSYYRRFVFDYANISDPLSKLTRKGEKYVWNPERQAAFEELKQKLTTAPILGLPNDEDEFILDTDASEFAIGAVLSQKQKGMEVVLAYGSRLLTKSERNYCTTRRELLAIVYFTKYFKTYLLGRTFLLRTDHAALQWLQRTPDPIGQQARWQERLAEFKFKIVHRPGKSHANADALSRRPEITGNVAAVAVIKECVENQTTNWTDHSDSMIAKEQENDPLLQKVRKWKTNGEPTLLEICAESEEVKKLWYMKEQIILENDVLYKIKNDGIRQLLMPKKLRKQFLEMCHSGMTGGHMGVRRTKAQVYRRAYWPGWSKDTYIFCRTCEECTRYKQGRPPKQGRLHPIPCGAPWEILAIDVTGPHPKSSKGYLYIFTMMDYFTKFVIAVPIRNQEAKTLAKIIVEKICAVFGTPLRLLSDKGPAFESELFTEICQILGIEKIRTTSYEPRTNGLIERYHRTMNQMIAKMVADNHRNWDEILPMVAAAYRASVHESTGFTPNYLIFGRENVMPVDIMYGLVSTDNCKEQHEYAQELKETFQYAYELVRQNMETATKKRIRGYNMGVNVKNFAVGDKVWVFIPRKRRFHYPKWEKYYQGPFEITAKTGPLNYRVQKLPRGRAFVVHVDKLIPYLGSEEVETRIDEQSTELEERLETQEESGKEKESTRLRPRGNLRRPLRFRED